MFSKKFISKIVIDKNLLIMLFIIILLCFISMLLQYSAGNGNFNKFALPQLIKIIFGLCIFFTLYSINIKIIYNIIELVYLICLLLIILVEILGCSRLGAQRWINLGILSLQPSEFMKVALILIISKLLAKVPNGQEGKFKNYIIPILLTLIPVLLIVIQPDLGTATILVISIIILIFISGLKLYYIIGAIIIAIIVAPIMWLNLYSYQKERILTFFNPYKDPLGSGYHIIQSKIAIGSGGYLGKGYLQGTQSQLNFIPEKQTDFIFALLTEELGFIGALILLILYSLIIIHCLILVLKSTNNFAKYAIAGLSNLIFIQLFLNIGMVIGILPVVGVPLPIISFGGTSIVTILISLALILNLNRSNSSLLIIINNYN